MVEHCAYLFLGDGEEKRNKIGSIKAAHLDKGLKDIDFEIVYSDNQELNPPKLNEILSYPPSNPSKKRVVHIKNIESLSKDNRGALIRYLKNPSKHVLLLLDSIKLKTDDAFIGELEPFAKKLIFGAENKLNAFDLGRAIVQRKTTDALKILRTLINSGERPEKILGALFWKWEDTKDKLSLDKFKQGLKLLLDTDIRIKSGKFSGRLKEELALELVVIRLSYLP